MYIHILYIYIPHKSQKGKDGTFISVYTHSWRKGEKHQLSMNILLDEILLDQSHFLSLVLLSAVLLCFSVYYAFHGHLKSATISFVYIEPNFSIILHAHLFLDFIWTICNHSWYHLHQSFSTSTTLRGMDFSHRIPMLAVVWPRPDTWFHIREHNFLIL